MSYNRPFVSVLGVAAERWSVGNYTIHTGDVVMVCAQAAQRTFARIYNTAIAQDILVGPTSNMNTDSDTGGIRLKGRATSADLSNYIDIPTQGEIWVLGLGPVRVATMEFASDIS